MKTVILPKPLFEDLVKEAEFHAAQRPASALGPHRARRRGRGRRRRLHRGVGGSPRARAAPLRASRRGSLMSRMRGASLVELIVVAAIIAILAATALHQGFQTVERVRIALGAE